MQTEMMNVSGVKCGDCSIKLPLALKMSVVVEDVQISLAMGEVTVRYNELRMSSSNLKDVTVRMGFGFDDFARRPALIQSLLIAAGDVCHPCTPCVERNSHADISVLGCKLNGKPIASRKTTGDATMNRGLWADTSRGQFPC